MKRLLIVLYCLPLFAAAQDKPLIAEGTSPNLYLNHIVVAKENYYSIGRMYNISPKEFAPYNNLTLDKGLALGQTIKIPLTANFLQSGEPAAGEVLVPVYHVVKDKESLYHISAQYGKVPVADLKKWNNLSGDAVSNGTDLIVGYLKVKKDLSPLAGKGVIPPATIESNVEVKPIQGTPKPVPVIAAPPKKIIKEEPVVTQPVKKEIEVKPAIKQETKPEPKEVVKEDAPATTDASTDTKEFNGGAFRSDYNTQMHGKQPTSENGSAAIFKSSSGWNDGMYYCLYNSAPQGTILKITNNVTGKIVYAKVLDQVPDMKENNGLLIRLSNAAASQLGVNDESKFDCTIEYSK